MFFTALSDEDYYFGHGKLVEENTFEAKPGKFIHFYTKIGLKNSFLRYKALEIGDLIDTIRHSQHR